MSIFPSSRVSASIGGKEILLETGRMANQAEGAAWVQCGDTVVLVTACTQPLERDMGFFPLTVDYLEKMYAAGRIPGSFFRREIGRPSERETLVSRLIDRPLRPLFPKAFRDEVQVLANVISADQANDSDVLALTGASTALCLSSIPFAGPVAGARIGRINGRFVMNPTITELKDSELNFIFAATREAVVMVEGEALFVPESVVAEALAFAHKEVQPLIAAQEELIRLAGKPKRELPPRPTTAPSRTSSLRSRKTICAPLCNCGINWNAGRPKRRSRKEPWPRCAKKAPPLPGTRPRRGLPSPSWAIWKKPSSAAGSEKACALTGGTPGPCAPS